MKKTRILYWSTTGVIASVMLWSALNFSFNPEMKGAFAHFGLPDWFKIELTVAKLLGSAALLLPAVPRKVKEFAYFGFGLVLISAPIAHLSSGDSLKLVIGHAAFLILLGISYYSWNKIRDPRGAMQGAA